MTQSSMSLHPDARDAFERMKHKKSHPFLIFRLDSTLEEIVLDTPPLEPTFVLKKGEEESFERIRYFPANVVLVPMLQQQQQQQHQQQLQSAAVGVNGGGGDGTTNVENKMNFGAWNDFPPYVKFKILLGCNGRMLFSLAVTSKSFWTLVMCREVWRPVTLDGLQSFISKTGNCRTPVLRYTYAWKDYYRYLRVRDSSEEIFFDYDTNEAPQERWTKFKITVPLTVSRFATVWFQYKTEKGLPKEELLLITCVPAGATARDKLDYLAEREGIQECFEGVNRDFLVRDEPELDYESIRRRCIKEDKKKKKLMKSRRFY